MAKTIVIEEKELTIVGTSPEMKLTRNKVTGKAEFTVDMKRPGMLYAKMLRSPYASAYIKKIDYNKALNIPGVIAVVTYEDAKFLYKPTHGSQPIRRHGSGRSTTCRSSMPGTRTLGRRSRRDWARRLRS